ncbi:hypothetical protein BH09MYX1_BH09MYX1_62200 [soil metagenome]
MARGDELLTNQVTIRLSDEDVARLDAMTARIPVASRKGIARAALRVGLDALEKNPARLVESPLPKRGRKPR